MKEKIRFFILYFSMILVFVLRYYVTTRIKLYEINCIEEGLVWLWYLRNGIDTLYYISEILLLLYICKTKYLGLIFEIIFLVFPGLLLLLTSSLMINPFVWTFSNSSYCIPFGAMLMCVFLYRRNIYKRLFDTKH